MHVHQVDRTGNNENPLIMDQMDKDLGVLFCQSKMIDIIICEVQLDFTCSPGGLDQLSFAWSTDGLDRKNGKSP